MIWLILALLLVSNPGGEIKLNLTDSGKVEISDQCIFFKDTFNNSAVLEPGLYDLKVGFNCSPGDKTIFLDGKTYATVRIKKLDDEDLNNATKVQIELLKTKKELSLTVEKLQEIVEELNKSMLEIEKLEKEKASLENELKILNERYEDLQMKYESISRELEGKKKKLMEMEKEVQSLSDLNLTYRTTMLFLVSIFIGSFTSLAIKGMRKS